MASKYSSKFTKSLIKNFKTPKMSPNPLPTHTGLKNSLNNHRVNFVGLRPDPIQTSRINFRKNFHKNTRDDSFFTKNYAASNGIIAGFGTLLTRLIFGSDDQQDDDHNKNSDAPRPSQENIQKSLADNVFTHVTPNTNLQGIMGVEGVGLNPQLGGKGGASEFAGNKRFIKNSAGFIHLGKDKEGIDTIPSKFYSDYYNNKSIPSSVLSVIPQNLNDLQPDQDDPMGGRYKTKTGVPKENIVHIPLPIAFRAPGTIGADYAPHNFVRGATKDIPGRTVQQRAEDIRRSLHRTEQVIYPDQNPKEDDK